MKNQQRGWFITLEGGEGVGKTSIIQPLTEKLQRFHIPIMVTREPGGVELAEKIRCLILNSMDMKMDIRTEALLYAAARRQHLIEKIIPALKQGAIVICDRFIDSSLAYQGYARGLGIEQVREINCFAIENQMPDITFWLDANPEVGLQRISANPVRENNRFDQEQVTFHTAVRAGYQMLAEQYQARIVRVDAEQSFEVIIENMYSILCARLMLESQ